MLSRFRNLISTSILFEIKITQPNYSTLSSSSFPACWENTLPQIELNIWNSLVAKLDQSALWLSPCVNWIHWIPIMIVRNLMLICAEGESSIRLTSRSGWIGSSLGEIEIFEILKCLSEWQTLEHRYRLYRLFGAETVRENANISLQLESNNSSSSRFLRTAIWITNQRLAKIKGTQTGKGLRSSRTGALKCWQKKIQWTWSLWKSFTCDFTLAANQRGH